MNEPRTVRGPEALPSMSSIEQAMALLDARRAWRAALAIGIV